MNSKPTKEGNRSSQYTGLAMFQQLTVGRTDLEGLSTSRSGEDAAQAGAHRAGAAVPRWEESRPYKGKNQGLELEFQKRF